MRLTESKHFMIFSLSLGVALGLFGYVTPMASAAGWSAGAHLGRDAASLHGMDQVVRVQSSSQRLREQNNEAEALFDDGQYEFDAKDYDAAKRSFKALLERFPDSRYALQSQKYLAIIYSNESKQARRSMRSLSSREVQSPAPMSKSTSPRWPERRSMASIPRQSPKIEARPAERFEFDLARQRIFLNKTGDRVFFAGQSGALGAKAIRALRRQAHWLKRLGDVHIRVVGHADDRPSDIEDMELSRARAEAVRERLIGEGVNADRIEVVAMGRLERIALCEDAICRAQNRRAIVRIMRPVVQQAASPAVR